MKPILLNLPEVIETERLTIRPMKTGDGASVFEAVEESRDHLKLWLPWVDSVKSPIDSEITAREFYTEFLLRKAFHFIILKENNFIGICGFNHVDWDIPSAAIGYWCRTSAQSNGYMQEAVAGITHYGFGAMGLKRISILCDGRNVKSINLAERLGFNLETEAKGLIPNLQGSEMTIGRRYVRFNSSGLEGWEAKW